MMARAPLRAVRPVMLRGVYANPEKELVRLRDQGRILQIAHGTYIVKPDDVPVPELWKPSLEPAGMAYAVATFGPVAPVLYGIGAARQWHAIPRAIGVTVVAVPRRHRPVSLFTGGRVIFTVRDTTRLDTQFVETEIGRMKVTTPEQTLIDLVAFPNLGSLPHEAQTAIQGLAARIDRLLLARLLKTQPAAAQRRVKQVVERYGQP